MFPVISKRGFTLIELLVVITIIGILATGGVAVYTSQIQKARDTNRMNDMKAIESGVEQYYQDNSYYPYADATFTGITVYVPKLPKDPKSGQLCNKGALTNATGCDYIYNVSPDKNLIINGEYKISIGFENDANVTAKAAKDGGAATETNRFEIGLNLTNAKATVCNRAAAYTSTALVSGVAVSATFCDTAGTSGVFIAN